MIVVTGATGHLGRLIVEKLLGRIPADRIAVSVRDPSKAEHLEKRGVRVRRGDFADPDSLRHVFEDASRVLLVSSNARARGGDSLAQHRVAIDAAGAAGARRIVYTSHMGASATSAFPPMLDHAATEDMLSSCGLAWTALRNGFYAASGIALLGDWKRTGVIEAPRDGPVAWTAHEDLAEAAAIILADEGRYDGPTPPLTGAEALDVERLTAVVSDLLGRPVERRFITDDAFRETLASRGVPGPGAAIAVGLYQASRAGEFAQVDPTLERLLGRKPLSMRDVLGQSGAS